MAMAFRLQLQQATAGTDTPMREKIMANKTSKPVKGFKKGKKLSGKKEIGKAQTLKPSLTLKPSFTLRGTGKI